MKVDQMVARSRQSDGALPHTSGQSEERVQGIYGKLALGL
jgi:hypothetical protein